ncbi:MAG: ABC transporter ATP-binding protein [Candidatus Moranbacteria bacterium]|nr:ABC transporter ATP-binding protein [Candidatus Moranbacteria bacterium]
MSSEKKKSAASLPIRKIFSCYWKVVRPYRWWFFVSLMSFGIGAVLANVFAFIAYKNIIDLITTRGFEARADIWRLVWFVAAYQAGQFFLFRVGDFSIFVSQSWAMRDLSRFAFSRLQDHSFDFFSNRFAGSLTSQMKRFVDSFITIQDGLYFNVWLNLIRLVSAFAVVFYFSPSIGFFFLFSITATAIIVTPLLKERWKRDSEEAAENTRVTGRFADVISNILTVKMFSARATEERAYAEYTEREEKIRRRAWNAFMRFIWVQNGLTTFLQVGMLFFAISSWMNGEITTGTVVIIQTYLVTIWGVVWELSNTVARFLKALSNASEMVEIFELPPSLSDPQDPEPCRISKGAIEFRNVSFGYDGGEPVFSRFSFAIRPGEKVGLVGPSGGGKSTITKLLLRFTDPQSGAVLVDGQDIRSIRQDDLRRNIAYVPQEPLLFHRPLRENISYGDPDATEERMFEASRRAHADEFIKKLPAGYETLVGERGVKLSGGQRQRVAIARAILKDAPILVLDEATSALDSESEHAIQEALSELMEGRTSIVIAHRLSTIRRMDRIVVLGEDGTIEEEGTHEDLLSSGGHYASMWARQTGGFIDEVPEEPSDIV